MAQKKSVPQMSSEQHYQHAGNIIYVPMYKTASIKLCIKLYSLCQENCISTEKTPLSQKPAAGECKLWSSMEWISISNPWQKCKVHDYGKFPPFLDC